MKVWNYIMIFTGLSVFFWMAGIELTGTVDLLTKIGFLNEGVVNLDSYNTLRTTVLTMLAAAAAAGIVVGFITKSSSENYVILPFITGVGVSFGLLIFINLGYSIINYAFTQADWIGYITSMIFVPLTVGFIIALLEFFRGTD